MAEPAELIDSMIDAEAQCMNKFDEINNKFRAIENSISDEMQLNTIIDTFSYSALRDSIAQSNDLISQINVIVSNSLEALSMYEINNKNNKIDEADNAFSIIKGFVSEFNLVYSQLNSSIAQSEQILNIGLNRLNRTN